VGLEPLSLWLIGIYALAIFFAAPISDASRALAATVWTRALCRCKKGGGQNQGLNRPQSLRARRAR